MPSLVFVAAISVTLTFTAVLYIGEIHKIPMTTALTRLEYMLAACGGVPTLEIRRQIADRAGRRYPSFSMADKLDAIQSALDRLETGDCIRPGNHIRQTAGLNGSKK